MAIASRASLDIGLAAVLDGTCRMLVPFARLGHPGLGMALKTKLPAAPPSVKSRDWRGWGGAGGEQVVFSALARSATTRQGYRGAAEGQAVAGKR